ncbi:MAG: WD40 repeat domain-containing protein, partial [Bacteroidota bacterium]
MKKQLFFLFFLLFSTLSFAQSSLDSLRLVLPIGHTGTVRSVKYSSDGKYFVTASLDHTARIFDSKTGKELRVIKLPEEIDFAQFLNDGKSLIVSGPNMLPRLYNFLSGELKMTYKSENLFQIYKVLLNPNDKYVIAASYKTVVIWDVYTGKIIRELLQIDGEMLQWDRIFIDPLDEICMNQNLMLIFYTNSKSKSKLAVIYDVESGAEIHRLKIGNSELKASCSFHNDKLAMTLNDSTIGFYNVQNWNQEKEIQFKSEFSPPRTNAKRILLDFTSDGKYFLTSAGNITSVYNLTTGSQVFSQTDTEQVLYAKFLDIGILDIGVGLLIVNDFILEKSISPINQIWIEGSWEDEISPILFHEYDFGPYNLNSDISSIDFSPNGKDFIFTTWENQVYIRSLVLSKAMDVKGKTKIFTDSGISHDKKLKLVCSTSSTDVMLINNYSNDTAKIIYTTHHEGIQSAEFNSSGSKMITAGNDGSIRITSVDNIQNEKDFIIICKELGRYESKKKETVFHFAHFSPNDAYYIGYGSVILSLKNLLVFKNAETGKDVWSKWRTKKYSKEVGTVCDFSPDGKNILFGSKDHSAKIIEIKTGSLLKKFNPTFDDWIKTTIYTPDGQFAIIFDQYGLCNIFNVISGDLIKAFPTKQDIAYCDFNTAGNMVNIHCWDHYTYVYDFIKGQLICLKLDFSIEESFYKLPNSPYYMCSKEASKML